MFGLSGADRISLDESLDVLPANLFGGFGNDTLAGGSGGDQLFGQSDNDLLLGKGGTDLLFGGAGNDVLIGEAGDDRLIWNEGDGSDLIEGGDGIDVAEVNGNNGVETFTLTANGTRVRFDRLDANPFALDIGTTETLVLRMGGGDDAISASTVPLDAMLLRLEGGAGDDTMLGGGGADLLFGDDLADLAGGDDRLFGGAGNDLNNAIRGNYPPRARARASTLPSAAGSSTE